ncbi:remorin 4.2 [Euphorbia lathyris]|uniref:remorin 4.2 n=1 Tax=Euphorbia lathyris TaxID=212925 RepID=UPI003313A1BC
MLSGQRAASTSNPIDHHQDEEENEHIRDIHALAPPPTPPPASGGGRWETGSQSISSELGAPSENFTTMSREFNALVLAGTTIEDTNTSTFNDDNSLLRRIREDDLVEETNPLAIVPGDNNPATDPEPSSRMIGSGSNQQQQQQVVSVQRVKKEEVETKIYAWQNAKIAKINNRFKREDAVINGWEGEQVQKASSWMKKVERKLEEKRARAMEKMQNDIAKAHRKAEERKASAESKRGTKVARVLEIANLMRAVGRPPAKRSFF